MCTIKKQCPPKSSRVSTHNTRVRCRFVVLSTHAHKRHITGGVKMREMITCSQQRHAKHSSGTYMYIYSSANAPEAHEPPGMRDSQIAHAGNSKINTQTHTSTAHSMMNILLNYMRCGKI